MPVITQPPETDLLIPLPGEGERWHPHTIHTHYFGFSVPEVELGAFIYIRYMPAFALCQGGVAIFRGTENVHVLDVDFVDFQITMPYPELDGNTISTANGLRVEFVEPGRVANLSFRSRDGRAQFDVVQTAVTPLFGRGHVMPGEDDHHDTPGLRPGGSEQYMHCVGEVTVNGERFDVDCFAPRDRSWRQVRTEHQGGERPFPPVGWSPMYFGEDLVVNQTSVPAPETNPDWLGIYELPEGTRSHLNGWVYVDGQAREITRACRHVLEHHPRTHVATKQQIEAEDDTGRVYRFHGEAIATAVIPAWPNFAMNDTVYRWEDERGRVSCGTYQEGWWDAYQRAISPARQRSGVA